jgi:6-phosphogluconolactonase (cycloisomerase 2 family)
MTIRTLLLGLGSVGLATAIGCGGGGKSHAARSTSAVTSASGAATVTSSTTAQTGSLVLPGSVAGTASAHIGGAPVAVVLPPTGTPVTTTTTRVDYTLSDADGDSTSVLVEVSIDDGRTWRRATDAGAAAGSQGVQGLTSSPTGTPHLFAWSAAGDLGRSYRRFVRLRITPTDVDGAGAPAATATFVLDLTAPATRVMTLGVPLDPAGTDQLIDYGVSAQGDLTRAAVQPPASGGQGRQYSASSGVVATPRGDVVVTSHNESADLSVFAVQPGTGLLAQVGARVPCSAKPTQLVMHPSGKFVYTTNGTDLEGYGFDAGGALVRLPGSPYHVGSSPRGLAIDPRGDAIYTGHMFGADIGVRVHRIDPATGVPTFVSALALGQSASRPGSRICVDPKGERLYCLDLDNGVFVATIDPTTRALTLVPGYGPRSLGGFALGMTLSTRGDGLYATVQGVGLLGFRIAPTGAFTTVPGAPYSNVSTTTLYLATDGPDRFLFASSRDGDNLRTYAIDPVSGALAEVPGSPRYNINIPVWVGPLVLLP